MRPNVLFIENGIDSFRQPGSSFLKKRLRRVWSLNDAENFLVVTTMFQIRKEHVKYSSGQKAALNLLAKVLFSACAESRKVQQSEIGPSPAFLSCRFLWFGSEEQAPHCESASHFLLQTASRDIRPFDLRSAGSQITCFCCFKWFWEQMIFFLISQSEYI